MLENVHELQWALQPSEKIEIISGKFSRAEIKLFQADVDECWNNFEIILFRTYNHDITQKSPPSSLSAITDYYWLCLPTEGWPGRVGLDC